MKKLLLMFAACILLAMNFPADTRAAELPSEIAKFMVKDSITDVNGEIFQIARPDPSVINKVNAAQFGLSPKNVDNYIAFSSAIEYCKEHPNTCLEISKGVYHFRAEKDLELNDLSNILIDGNGSEFIFSTPKYFKINNCNGLEMRELAIEWDWESSRLASLVRIHKCNKIAKTFEIEFMELDDVDLDIPIICFMQFAKDTLTPGSYGGYKTFYPDQVKNGIVKKEKVAPNRIKLYFGQESYMNNFHDDEVYLIRHYTYGGRVFQPAKSENITFDDIHIYSAAGMGYIISDSTKFFQIINSSIGRRTDRVDAPYISTTADGIHILNTGGYFRIENCDFSFTGDDIMNIHDDVMVITKRVSDTVFKGKVTGGFVKIGEKVSFRNAQMGLIDGYEDLEIEVADFTRDSKTYDATITLKNPVGSAIKEGSFIYRTSMSTSNYVIKNNYIHETKGRAMLVLGSNALIENNTIYRTVSEGIHVLADVSSKGEGSQGVGASNVIIRGNTLTECTVSNKQPVIMIRYQNGDTKSQYKNVLSNIRVEDNQLIGCYVDAMEFDNITNLVIKNNIIQDSGKMIVGDHCSNVTNTGNRVTTTTHLDSHDVIVIQGYAPSCVSYGMKPLKYCNDCHKMVTDVIGIKPIDHTPGNAVIENKVEASCGEAGSYDEVIYCTECEQEITRKTKEIAATGDHDFSKYVSLGNGKHKVVCKECDTVWEGHESDRCFGGKATCKARAKCTKCKEAYGTLGAHVDSNKDEKCDVCAYNMHKHVGTKVAQVNSTCTRNGVKTYYKCSCGKYYSDAACTKVISDLAAWKAGDGKIAKKAHTLKTTTAKATTLVDGKKITKCSVCGKVTKTVTINKIQSVTLAQNTYAYDGKSKKPAVIVKDSKGNTVAATNYTVTYPSGRKNVGKYTVKVTFKTNYSGSKSIAFTIKPMATTISSVTPAAKAFTVKWAKRTAQVDGYSIQYATNDKFTVGLKKVTVSNNTTVSKKIGRLQSKKTYYIRIRTYKKVGTQKYYSAWSKVSSVQTK